jgi:hypothetical protein
MLRIDRTLRHLLIQDTAHTNPAEADAKLRRRRLPARTALALHHHRTAAGNLGSPIAAQVTLPIADTV